MTRAWHKRGWGNANVLVGIRSQWEGNKNVRPFKKGKQRVVRALARPYTMSAELSKGAGAAVALPRRGTFHTFSLPIKRTGKPCFVRQLIVDARKNVRE
ncbi:hypothetical protein KDI_53100 [Dictyobacter arantiisoli]|uniref:Uncharacterized protein n=1 Tax=Dictyobacter arantiisoli TaxID=2014874 RepID=A0A5A5TKW3_9CHLR|nr:hypothetical protein KDI_53100 [Dictyobacter arantiisoli]